MEKQTVLVYVEAVDGQPVKVSLEALNAGAQYAKLTGKKVTAVMIGDASAANVFATYGADAIVTVAADAYQAESYAAILAELCKRSEATALLIGATADGKELAARVAAQLHVGCVTDAIALSEGNWVRSVYSGSLMETEAVEGQAVISVRSGSFGKPDQDTAHTAPVTEETVATPEIRTMIKEVVNELSEDVNLEDAEVIVAGGRGMGSAENFKLVEQLAELLGGVVGASRPAIEDNWVPRNHQVGQSGKIVAPKLYIACGISGATQHVSGMSGSGYIVAINKDEDAPIFDIADVGIVGNVNEILPLMIEEIKARKA